MLKFGTGGTPLTAKSRSPVDGIKRTDELGLNAMELEFVHQVYLNEQEAKVVNKLAKKHNVTLTAHGSYYINLASKEKHKIKASIKRILKAARIGSIAGAKSITFHPAFYQSREEDAVFKMVEKAFEEIFTSIENQNIEITVSPELTGKQSQFGTLEELIKLVEHFPNANMAFCFDIAHKHARTVGEFNGYDDFDNSLKKIKSRLGERFLKNMHIHMSGIEYSKKGERNHLTFLPSQDDYKKKGIKVGDLTERYKELSNKSRLKNPEIKWKELMQALKDNKVGGTLICESPNLEEDTLLMKNYYESI